MWQEIAVKETVAAGMLRRSAISSCLFSLIVASNVNSADAADVAAWIALLKGDAAGRDAAIAALPVAQSSDDIAILARAIASDDPRIRRYAARAFGEAVAVGQVPIRHLASLLRDRDETVRNETTVALARQPEAIAVLVEALTWNDVAFPNEHLGTDHRLWTSDRFDREEARPSDYAVIALIEHGANVIVPLLATLKTSDQDGARQRHVILAKIGEPTVAALAALLDDPDPARADWAAAALIDIEGKGAAACSALSRILADSKFQKLRTGALDRIEDCPATASLLPGLVHDSDTRVRSAAWQQIEWGIRSSDPAMVRSSYGAFLQVVEAWPGEPDTDFGLFVANVDIADRQASPPPELRQRLTAAVRKMLTSSSPSWRFNGAELSGHIGDIGGGVAADLAHAIDDPVRDVSAAAIESLAAIGHDAAAAAPELISAYRRSGRRTSALLDAYAAVAPAEKAVPVLRSALFSPETRFDAIRAAARLGISGAPLSDDIAALTAGGNSIQFEKEILPTLRAVGPAAAPRLLEELNSIDPRRRISTLRSLERADITTTDARRAVNAAFFDPDPAVREAAIALSTDADGGLAVGSLIDDDDPTVRRATFERLQEMSGCAGGAAGLLRRKMMLSEEADARSAAITLLIVDPEAADALPTVTRALSEACEPGPCLSDSAQILKRHADRVWKPLAKLLPSASPIVAMNVLDILATANTLTSDVVPTLRNLLESNEPAVRVGALTVIRRLGAGANAASSSLIRSLDDPNPVARSLAAETLFAIDPSTTSVAAWARVTADEFVTVHVSSQLHDIIDAVRPPSEILVSATIEALPPLPEIGIPSAYDVLRPDELLARRNETLRDAWSRLSTALRASGYDEQGLFYVPQGFALATKLERIHPETGLAYQPPDRWTRNRLRPHTLRQYLSTLFMEKPGVFRLFVFVVTPALRVDTGSSAATEAAFQLPMTGGRMLPDTIAKLPFAHHHCHVLIYTFEKKAGRVANILNPDALGFTAEVAAAGFVSHLGR